MIDKPRIRVKAISIPDGATPQERPAPATAAPHPVREPVTNSELTLSCDVRAAAAAEINVGSDASPMQDGGTCEECWPLTNGDSLVLQPALTGRGPCDSGATEFSLASTPRRESGGLTAASDVPPMVETAAINPDIAIPGFLRRDPDNLAEWMRKS